MHHDKRDDKVIMILSGLLFSAPIILMAIAGLYENILLLYVGAWAFATLCVYAMGSAMRKHWDAENEPKKANP